MSGLGDAATARPCDSVVDVYRTPEYAAFEQEHRRSGTFGLTMLRVEQGAVETVDPAMPELIIAASGSTVTGDIDFGDGWVRRRMTPAVVDVQPAYQDCGLRLPAMSLSILAARMDTVAGLLEEVRAAPTALDAVTGTFRELPRARELVDRLWGSMHGTGAAASLLTDGLFMTLVGELLEASGQGALPAALPGAGDRRLVRAAEYVEEHLGTALTVGELAAVATMSRSGFARAFRRAYGEPVWSWVQGRRTARALELLKGTTVPIAQVAERCGFASQSHLTSVVRERCGVTPGAVRRG